MDRRLVDHLVNSSLVSRAAMQRMILRASKDKTSVVEQLFADGKFDEEALARELAAYYGLAVVTPGQFAVNETALKFISKSMANKHGVLPFAVSDAADHVTVAVANPEAAQSVLESLKTATGREPSVQVAPRGWLQDAIRHFYFGEAWSQAPAHGAQTREVSDISADYGPQAGISMEESSEIVLDEVVVPPRPRPKRAAAVTAVQQHDQTPQPRQRRASQSATPLPPQQQEPPQRRSSRSGTRPEGHVDAALDEFDAFLEDATGWGNRSGASGIPGWDDDAPDPDPFSFKDDAPGWEPVPGSSSNGASGFNLFDEKSEGRGSLQATVEEHTELIERLRREIQQQRDIITALVDALAESGVVSKREIKHRVKRK